MFLISAGILCLAPCFVEGQQAGASQPPDEGFEPLRRPVLGLVLERHREKDLHRLIAIKEDSEGRETRKTVVEGSLDDCEKGLVKTLKERYGTGNVNLVWTTLGGKQFWADVFVYCGWRIQQNEYTDHYRLLDPDDRRQAWGSYEACRTMFEEQRVRLKIRPRSEHLVMLIHGLFRSKDSFAKLSEALGREGYEVASVNYPSTRASIHEHADQLEQVLDAMEGATRISFVTHSLGGIVVRDLLARDSAWKRKIKVQRLVMLGPPNRGSLMASVLKDWFPYKVLAGKAGRELVPEEVAKIPLPACPYGIIAGGTGTEKGLNPLLPGDNDGTVLVKNTRLETARDFMLIDCLHSSLMKNDAGIKATIRFLKTGRFSPEAGESEPAPPTKEDS